MLERDGGMESDGAYLDNFVSRGYFCLIPVFRTALPLSGGLSPEEGLDAVTWFSSGKLSKERN